MAYSANFHDNYARRQTNLMRQLYAFKQEGERLKAIYTNEAASGTDPAYVDTPLATAAELTEAINVINAVTTVIDAQITNITPFLQGE